MNKLLALADRVEKLTGPDDDVFREAFDACFPKPERVWEDEGRECWSTEYENHHNLSWRFESFLEVGAYLEAAMTLVPDDECWRVGHDADDPSAFMAQCSYTPHAGGMGFVVGYGDSPALALTCAALRARAHGGGEG